MAMMQKSKIQNTTDSNIDVDSMPIAASGFWAKGNVLIDCVVPKISGVGCVSSKKSAKPAQQPNGRLMEAKKHADVGENIRWDIICQEAAKLPCILSNAAPSKSDSDDGMSTSCGGSTDSDADTDSNSGYEHAVNSKPGQKSGRASKSTNCQGTPQCESRVYSVFTMLRVWDLCCRSLPPASGETDVNDPKSFAPPPGLAAPPGLSTPPRSAPQTTMTPSPVPRNQKNKKISNIEAKSSTEPGCKETKVQKNKQDKPLREEPASRAAPWRRNTMDVEDIPLTQKPKASLDSAPWKRSKESTMKMQTTTIAPPPGL